MGGRCFRNADVASGSPPELKLWAIILLRSSHFVASFRTIRIPSFVPTGFL